MKGHILILFLFITVNLIYAQDLKIDKEIFVSNEYFYSYNINDSTLYKFYNHSRIAYEVPTKIKAQFDIKNNGFGFIDKYPRREFSKIDNQLKKYYDSIFVQILPRNNNYVIKYTKGDIIPIDTSSSYRTDTVNLFRELLLSDDFSIPYLYVVDNNTGKTVFLKYKDRISWKDKDATHYVEIINENKNHINKIINGLVYEVNYSSKNKVSESPFDMNLRFIRFKVTKTQLVEMVEMLKKDQIILEVKKEEPKILLDNSEFTNLLRTSFFVSNNGYPLFLDNSNGRIHGSTSISNIYEINDSLIKYTSTSKQYTNGVFYKKTDSLSVNVVKCSKYKYLLDFDESLSKMPFFKTKDDTITEFTYAIKNDIIEIKDLKIINLLNDKLILKISIDDNVIVENGKNLYLKENGSLMFRENIKDLITLKNFPRINAPYEIVYKLNGVECSTYQSKKNIDSFIKRVNKYTNKTSR